ncbi:MAG TPA: inorganic phosphate transporter, partial [Candidatus Lokiarchaeia archaeon]
METTTILLVLIILGMVIAFSIGGNDETFACIYGSKTLTLREILILSTIFAILGAIFLGRAVSETVGKNILYIKITTSIVITVLIS